MISGTVRVYSIDLQGNAGRWTDRCGRQGDVGTNAGRPPLLGAMAARTVERAVPPMSVSQVNGKLPCKEGERHKSQGDVCGCQ